PRVHGVRPHSKHGRIRAQLPIENHRFPALVATTTNPARPNISSAAALPDSTHGCGRSAGLLLDTNVTDTSRTPSGTSKTVQAFQDPEPDKSPQRPMSRTDL
ncbi:hypothetical protein, partial [Corynebacterium sp. HMSC05C01]|uniref:hypothetical protein n=1 Tax=Corynebacterium sp. HMSC05C01 TaxID=1581113 RepID=UPI001AEF3E0B